MASQLEGRRVAFLVANEGVEQIELTVPWRAIERAGGVMGKMIDAQSIVVASTATDQVGKEAAIFRAVFKHSIVLAALVGLLVMGYAYLWISVIP